jgi:O-acetyl-ADP-ribose deacetylase (regulator of RNase III)
VTEPRIRLTRGDITTLAVDAVVNAANSSLLGGAGVDGAIHRAAGAGLLHECRALGGCPTGEARITGGYRLPARYVIHTVGPVYAAEGARAADLLAACYRNSLTLAVAHGVRTIAFPAISCGAYGYPPRAAAAVAVGTVAAFVADEPRIAAVHLVCFGEAVFEAYAAAYQAVPGAARGAP